MTSQCKQVILEMTKDMIFGRQSSKTMVRMRPKSLENFRLLFFVRCTAYGAFVGLFLYQSYSFMNQFSSMNTTMSISIETPEKKNLPLITICAFPVYKFNTFPMTELDFKLATFTEKDIFTGELATDLKNKSNWTVTSVKGNFQIYQF